MKRRKWIILAALMGVLILCIGIEFLSPHKGWRYTGSLHHPRLQPAVTVLADGRVLVTGGLDKIATDNKVLASCELYDPTTGEWTETAPMARPRFSHTATLLPDGRVQACGGTDQNWDVPFVSIEATPNCEIYDPIRDSWSPAAKMTHARFAHCAFASSDGTVVICGGLLVGSVPTTTDGDQGYQATITTEIYNAKLNSWKPGPDMLEKRAVASTCPLSDGTVGVVGGVESYGFGDNVMSECATDGEIYNPRTKQWLCPI